jgi:hypothetical protein
MAAMSNKMENFLIDHIFRATGYTMPTTLFIALCTTTPVAADTGTTLMSGGGTGTEVSGGSYTRVAYNPSASANWTATQGGTSGASSGTSGTTNNSTAITFSTASGSWGTVNGVAICDAFTNGNMLFFGSLTSPKTVGTSDIFQFNSSQLSLSLS